VEEAGQVEGAGSLPSEAVQPVGLGEAGTVVRGAVVVDAAQEPVVPRRGGGEDEDPDEERG
jgi:hypothetical protein